MIRNYSRQAYSGVLLAGLLLITPSLNWAADDCRKAGRLSEEAGTLVSTMSESAVAKLREAVALCPGSSSLHFNLGIALYKSLKSAEAEQALEQSLTLNPSNAKSLNALSYLLYKTGGDKVRAEQLARQAVSLDPQNANYQETLALVLPGSPAVPAAFSPKVDFDVDAPIRTGVSKPDAIAVVIGNQKYKHSILPSVAYAARDAATVKKYLVESLGFSEHNILYYENASFVDFLTVFGDANDHRGLLYNRTRKEKSDIFIYYSGHGAPDTNTRKAYIVPSDADPSIIKFSGYSLDTLYENLAKVRMERAPRSVTVVFDSCFSGGSDGGMIIADASPIYIETTSPVLTMQNAVVFSSSKGNQISSWYPEKKHGLFTYFFLKALREQVAENKTFTAGDIERALVSDDGVNDHALRLYNRFQEPQVIGNRDIVYVQ